MVSIRMVDAKFDAAQIASIYKPFVLGSPITFESVPPDEFSMYERISKVTAHYPWLVCESNDNILGYAHGSRFRERQAYEQVVETTVYVKESSQGIGVGLGLYTSLINCLKSLGFAKAVGVVAIPNKPSQNLHKRAGYKHEATLPKIGLQHGIWQDIEIWTLQLRVTSRKETKPIDPNKLKRDNAIKNKEKSFFGLPGNPISSAACFRFFVYTFNYFLYLVYQTNFDKSIIF